MFFMYLLPHENISILNKELILFNDLCARQMWNIFSDASGILNKESLTSESKFPSFPTLLKALDVSWKEKASCQSMLAHSIAEMPTYIGKATSHTRYAMSQHKMLFWNCTTTYDFHSTHLKKIPVFPLIIYRMDHKSMNIKYPALICDLCALYFTLIS